MLWISTKKGTVIWIVLPFVYHGFAHFTVHLRISSSFIDANSLDRQHSKQAHGKRKVVQLRWQLLLFVDSHMLRSSRRALANTAYFQVWTWDTNSFSKDSIIPQDLRTYRVNEFCWKKQSTLAHRISFRYCRENHVRVSLSARDACKRRQLTRCHDCPFSGTNIWGTNCFRSSITTKNRSN